MLFLFVRGPAEASFLEDTVLAPRYSEYMPLCFVGLRDPLLFDSPLRVYLEPYTVARKGKKEEGAETIDVRNIDIS